MKNLELILPFSIPPSGLENDLLKAMQTPALATLIAFAKRMPITAIDPFSKALIHEYLLADELQGAHDCDPPVTLNRMQDMGLQLTEGRWFTLQPVHIHIARDHLVLTDQRRLDISEPESRVLFDIAKTAADEAGMTLQYGDASTWFLRADGWAGLKTASADAACGHNVDIWMPDGEHARAWRKLQNEIQMLWFTHTLNDEREALGKKVINSVWLSGGAGTLMRQNKPTHTAHSFGDLLTGSDASSTDVVCVLLEQLTESAINSDWGQWLSQIQTLENEWFAPVLAALKNRQLDSVTLFCSDAHRLASFRLTPWSLRQFWIKPSLQALFTLKPA
ncbi:hypothetical protein KDM87_06415 [Undibacterium sp. FT147W]|uniref:Cofactor-independent phosphoglycerate mutase n=1 Tax=Undibacterium rivi TaxID=2828729 RepID=A0ABS5H1G7_9BURK|nr:hypothetical protein [Undibacterium rivi]MBR7792227.1 hypothetical protein [Undibacterium rivi]